MDVLLFVVGVIIAALVLVFALVGTVALYLGYCKRHPSKKFRAEVFVVVTVTLLSLIIRMAIGIAATYETTLVGGIKSFFHGMFSAVAGLTFNSLLELGDTQVVGGILACFYYGIIIYASLVFLTVVTVGLSYEFYSRVQTFGFRRRFCRYYVFTAITRDSLILAEDIKRRREEENRRAKAEGRKQSNFAIIFFEDGQESFSRKNALHRIIMEQGFLYYSDFRRGDKGEVISFLQTFKFRKKDCVKDDTGFGRNRLFYVFATGDCGGFEGDNGELVFDDLSAVLRRYVRAEKGVAVNNIPTVINYFLLTGGEINYDSYERRLTAAIKARCAEVEKEGGKIAEGFFDKLKSNLQVNVFNEASLSSQNMIARRTVNLLSEGAGSFRRENAPDDDNSYRIAVIGFGKTGQYAMEELYTHSAYLSHTEAGFVTDRFIADIYELRSDDVSGLFAYGHPLFCCLNEDSAAPSPTKELIERADGIKSEAFDLLYTACEKKCGKNREEAEKFVRENMQFPIAAFHSQSVFKFPLMDSETADAAVNELRERNFRAFVVALGDDEKNIAAANMLIAGLKRAYLGGGLNVRRVTIFVNLIEERSAGRLDWREEDVERYKNAFTVVPFGCRTEMFSYATLIDDYASRLYHFGYSQFTEKTEDGKDRYTDEDRKKFTDNLNSNPDAYRGDDKVSDGWLSTTPFLRQSNKSAQTFGVNYFDFAAECGGVLSAEKTELAVRLEHERWCRFHISHGWIYADYPKSEKSMRRSICQHTCLCPFDEMLDDYTKQYDLANVKLGLIKGIICADERIKGGKID